MNHTPMANHLRKRRVRRQHGTQAGILRFCSVRTLHILVLAGVALMFVGYLAMNTQAATKGFAIKSLERRISALKDEQKKLGIAAIAHQSMDIIDAEIKTLGMVPVTYVDYVSAVPAAMAVR